MQEGLDPKPDAAGANPLAGHEGGDEDMESFGVDLEGWKAALRRDFERWLEGLEAIPEAATEDGMAEEIPDLYSFYEQLAASTAENRKVNRRTAEVFGQWAETLSRFETDLALVRKQLSAQAEIKPEGLPRSWSLALAEMMERAERVSAAFGSPPAASWWGSRERWRKAWESQRQASAILVTHLEALLAKAEVTRMEVMGRPFDPTTMAAVACEYDPNRPHHTVIEEVGPGYLWRGELLRVAQVRITERRSDAAQEGEGRI